MFLIVMVLVIFIDINFGGEKTHLPIYYVGIPIEKSPNSWHLFFFTFLWSGYTRRQLIGLITHSKRLADTLVKNVLGMECPPNVIDEFMLLVISTISSSFYSEASKGCYHQK